MTNKLIERLINKEYLTERERKEWLNAVKERLEVLEKENKEWREIVGCDLCEALGREILLEENEKLKKALDILKKYYKIIVKDCDFPIYETPRYTLGIRFNSWGEKPEGLFAYITKEDFELLKEVLGE